MIVENHFQLGFEIQTKMITEIKSNEYNIKAETNKICIFYI